MLFHGPLRLQLPYRHSCETSPQLPTGFLLASALPKSGKPPRNVSLPSLFIDYSIASTTIYSPFSGYKGEGSKFFGGSKVKSHCSESLNGVTGMVQLVWLLVGAVEGDWLVTTFF